MVPEVSGLYTYTHVHVLYMYTQLNNANNIIYNSYRLKSQYTRLHGRLATVIQVIGLIVINPYHLSLSTSPTCTCI